jgi:hypothetical protein
VSASSANADTTGKETPAWAGCWRKASSHGRVLVRVSPKVGPFQRADRREGRGVTAHQGYGNPKGGPLKWERRALSRSNWPCFSGVLVSGGPGTQGRLRGHLNQWNGGCAKEPWRHLNPRRSSPMKPCPHGG